MDFVRLDGRVPHFRSLHRFHHDLEGFGDHPSPTEFTLLTYQEFPIDFVITGVALPHPAHERLVGEVQVIEGHLAEVIDGNLLDGRSPLGRRSCAFDRLPGRRVLELRKMVPLGGRNRPRTDTLHYFIERQFSVVSGGVKFVDVLLRLRIDGQHIPPYTSGSHHNRGRTYSGSSCRWRVSRGLDATAANTCASEDDDRERSPRDTHYTDKNCRHSSTEYHALAGRIAYRTGLVNLFCRTSAKVPHEAISYRWTRMPLRPLKGAQHAYISLRGHYRVLGVDTRGLL